MAGQFLATALTMAMILSEHPCPCGSGQHYGVCCGPFIAGRSEAPTAEALMRSRYSAYALGEIAYLSRTWHPDHCPDEAAIGEGAAMQWLGLEVVSTEAGCVDDETGKVEFVARFKLNGRAARLHELSEFVRVAGQWRYRVGELIEEGAPAGPSRNAPCPCGSGKKYKRCCARD